MKKFKQTVGRIHLIFLNNNDECICQVNTLDGKTIYDFSDNCVEDCYEQITTSLMVGTDNWYGDPQYFADAVEALETLADILQHDPALVKKIGEPFGEDGHFDFDNPWQRFFESSHSYICEVFVSTGKRHVYVNIFSIAGSVMLHSFTTENAYINDSTLVDETVAQVLAAACQNTLPKDEDEQLVELFRIMQDHSTLPPASYIY